MRPSTLVPSLHPRLRPIARWLRIELELLRRLMVGVGASPWVTGAVGVFAIALHSARTALDRGIAQIHPPGVPGFGVNSLNEGPAVVDEVLRTWEAGDAALSDFVRADATTFAKVQTTLELLLLPFTVMALILVASALIERANQARTRQLHERWRADVYISMLKGAIAAAAAYGLLGLWNQVVELLTLFGWRVDGLETTLRFTGPVRRVMLILALVPIVVTAVQLERSKPKTQRFAWWRGSGSAFRVLIVAVAVHSMLLLFSIPGEQAADALRLWVDRPSLGVIGVLATMLLSTMIGTIAIRLRRQEAERRVLSRPATSRMLGISVALMVIGFVLHQLEVVTGVLAVGIIGFLVAVISLPIAASMTGSQVPTGDVANPSDSARRRLPAVLAAAPPLSLMVALINAAVPSVMDASSSAGWWVLTAWGLFVAALAVATYGVVSWFTDWAKRRLDDRAADPAAHAGTSDNKIFTAVVGGGGLLSMLIAWVVAADSVGRGPAVGVIALVALFMTIVAAVLGGVGYLFESRPLPAALDIVGFRRLPILTGLIVWGFVANQLSPGGFHDVRTIEHAGDVTPQESLTSAFNRWQDDRFGDEGADADASADETAGDVVAEPLVLIATAGGGLKAAAFTAAAVDCVFGASLSADAIDTLGSFDMPDECTDENRWSSVFMASGASGGSVGLASVVAQSAEPQAALSAWVQDRLGADLLSPELSWQLFVETPNALLGFDPAADRADVLERTWQDRFRTEDGTNAAEQAFYRPPGDDWEPLLFLSGTSLGDGCRVDISPIESEVASGQQIDSSVGDCTSRRVTNQLGEQSDTRDLTDYLCGGNIDLATAAFLSARFPYVSPVATQTTCDDPERTLVIADGGYRDNSGAGSVLAAWQTLGPQIERLNAGGDRCIVPIVLEISSGYAGLEGSPAASDLAQVLAPAIGAGNVFGDLSYGPIEELASEFAGDLGVVDVRSSGGFSIGRYFRLSLIDHPGVRAPLGWSLSDDAANDLVDQLRNDDNLRTIDALTSLLEPGALTCVPRSR